MRRCEIRALQDSLLAERLAARLCQLDCLSDVPVPLVTKLVGLGELVDLEPGEVLIREGEWSAPEIYLLIEGVLAVQTGGAVIARLDQPGDVVGEVAVLMSSKRTADVIAESQVQVIAFRPADLKPSEFADVEAILHRVVSRGVSNKLSDDWVQY